MTRRDTTDWGLLILRVGWAGLLVFFHGWGRLRSAGAHLFFGQPWSFVGFVERIGFPFPLAFALLSTAAEAIAPCFVALGLYTRFAVLATTINMSVAVFNEIRGGDSPELPALYLLGAIVVLCAGPGRYVVNLRRSRG